jgi:DnaJ-class molecular chaperone
MGVLCNTCQGSGRMAGFGVAQAHQAGMACGYCEGLGYRRDSRRAAQLMDDVEVGKVLAYDGTMGAAQVYLEETIHRGDSLVVVAQGLAMRFQVDTILVAGMQLTMALKGWEVTLLVPQPMQPGAWIMRCA